jgi:uncharacterized membrane protein
MFARIALAQTSVEELFEKATQNIVNPIITLFLIGALVLFVFGIFEFIKGADNDEARNKGKQHMIWGIVGLFIMVSVFAIIRVLLDTFGINLPSDNILHGK